MGKGGEGRGGQGGEEKGREGRGGEIRPPPPQNIFGLTPLALRLVVFVIFIG